MEDPLLPFERPDGSLYFNRVNARDRVVGLMIKELDSEVLIQELPDNHQTSMSEIEALKEEVTMLRATIGELKELVTRNAAKVSHAASRSGGNTPMRRPASGSSSARTRLSCQRSGEGLSARTVRRMVQGDDLRPYG